MTWYRNHFRFILNFGLLIFSIIAIMLASKFLYAWLTPLFYGIGWFLITEPLASWFHKKGVSKNLSTFLSIWFWLIVLLGIGGSVVYMAIIQIQNVSNLAPSLSSNLITIWENFNTWATEKLAGYNAEFPSMWNEYIQVALNNANEIGLVYLKKIATAGATILPSWVGNTLFGLIFAYFFSLEKERWMVVGKEKSPDLIKKSFYFFKTHVWSKMSHYIKAQGILMSCVFVWLLIGFVILGAKQALLLAFLCAILDILPLIGSSIVIIPWLIVSLMQGNTFMAIGLGILYAVSFLFRQFAEPKLVGESLGVSPFIMILGTFLSYVCVGVVGLIVAPILILLVKAIIEQGIWRHWMEQKTEAQGDES